MSSQKPEVKREKSEDYRVIHVSNVYGGHRPDHFEIVLRTDVIDASESEDKNKPVIKRIEQACLKLSPEQAKSLHAWLGDHLEKYEEDIREIGKVGPEEGKEPSPMYR